MNNKKQNNQSIAEQTFALLKTYNIKPDDNKSQNFLIDDAVYEEIVISANLSKQDTVLEIGSGLGFLTNRLLDKAGKVLSVELDKKLVKILKQTFEVRNSGPRRSVLGKLGLINQDIIKFDETKLPVSYKLVANLPYHLTGRIFKKFLTSTNKPQNMVVLVQKEVAERICASPSGHSLLSLSVQRYGMPEIINIVNRDSFYPVPKVDSAILRINNIKPTEDQVKENFFWQMLKIGFSNKRKTLVHNLSAGFKKDKKEIRALLKNLDLGEMVRAQELSMEEWEELASRFQFSGFSH